MSNKLCIFFVKKVFNILKKVIPNGNIEFLGIGIGMIVTSGSTLSAETPTTTVLQGMAAGTLIYVVFFEVLHRERTNLAHAGIWQFLAVLVGFLVMFGLINAGKAQNTFYLLFSLKRKENCNCIYI